MLPVATSVAHTEDLPSRGVAQDEARADSQCRGTERSWGKMGNHQARLVESILSSEAVLILGAGASMAMTRAAPTANWVGLIRNGIESAADDKEWATIQTTNLEYALKKTDVAAIVGVAGQISAKLRAQGGGQAYSDWLREAIGSLRPAEDELAKTLGSLDLPILTTNYDTLVESVLGWSSADWTEVEMMRDAFRGRSRVVGHLHGVWNKPDTVIFSESDYTRLLMNEKIQFVQQAQYSTKSFVYIGFGGGMHDPNFSRLLERHGKMFPESRGDHFRLCRTSEAAELESGHSGHDIRVVTYGDDYSDLASFFTDLASTLGSVASSGDRLTFAREALLDSIRDETVVISHLEDGPERELSEITVPPVMLPVPHEQFASMQDYDNDVKPRRIDAESTHAKPKVLILAGEELSGLTTALRWVTTKATFGRPGVAPIFVDGRRCHLTRNPLNQQVKYEAVLRRVIDHKKDSIPRHVLAVDNLIPDDSENYYRIITDLLDSEAEFISIGARIGDEHRLASDLANHRLPVEIVYLGKLGRAEISSLAKIVAPKRVDFVTEAVQDALWREHLPRNPFTISLLVCLFAQLGEASKHSSETAVLDDYVSLLLGRNGPEILDARVALDPQNRQVVLAQLAKEFVRRRKGALGQDEAIRCISEYFKSVGWKEDPIRTLETFRAIRVIRVSGGVVQFQQSSYLHLFAAKAAIDDENFLTELLDDVVFFGPIIRHYAALLRNDERVVKHVEELLNKTPINPPSGRLYARVERKPAPENIGNLLQGPPPEDDQGHRDASAIDTGNDSAEIDEYDYSDDADMVPFPLEDQSKLPPTIRRIRAVDLASRVLRDSDALANLELKFRLLKRVLREWGAAADALEYEKVFDEPSRMLVDTLVESGDLKAERADEMASRFSMLMGAFVIFAGVSASLSSRKLLLLQEKLAEDAEFCSDEYGSVVAAMFAFDVQESGWTSILPALAKLHGDRWIVAEFIGMLASVTYRMSELSSGDEANLKTFLLARAERRYTFSSEQHRKSRIAQYEQDLVRDRLFHSRKRLPAGSSVMDGIGRT